MPTTEIDQREIDFGRVVLSTTEARIFFRGWRRKAGDIKDCWSGIRDAEFAVGTKHKNGAHIISRLRDHLVQLQADRCCYCQRSLQGIAYAKPIEHVLSRKNYPQYTFYYRNLAVACYDCNQAKRAAEWSNWPTQLRRYISARNCTAFFHPRLHSYDEHIRYLRIETNGASISTFLGLTAQGQQLCRDLLQKSAGRQLATSANPRFSSAMHLLRSQINEMTQTASSEKLVDLLEALDLAAFPNEGNIP